jgi:alpha-D-xyloside xylohydrolase
MRNRYSSSYIEAYSNFIGKNRVLFSRAGFKGQQNYPMQWAGDQMSTWEEFGHILKAGLSIGLSGVPFWGFDIAGFAGPMPSVELYERATQLAVFSPIMQWHSEPVGGQFAELMPNADGINDRSPWNISKVYQEESLLERISFHYNLRMNLLPYLYHQALLSGENGQPMMKHLIMEYPQDPKVYDIEDSFILGDILIAPIMKEGSRERIVYLPEGTWTGLWPMTAELVEANMAISEAIESKVEGENISLKGGRSYQIWCGTERIPAFIRDGGCLALNLGVNMQLGSNVHNQTSGYTNLCFYMAGETGEYHFVDDEDNKIDIYWNDGSYEVKQLAGKLSYQILEKL